MKSIDPGKALTNVNILVRGGYQGRKVSQKFYSFALILSSLATMTAPYSISITTYIALINLSISTLPSF